MLLTFLAITSDTTVHHQNYHKHKTSMCCACSGSYLDEV